MSIRIGISECVLPEGQSYTFWGKGVSQGHSDAVRRIKGVKNAKQYTIPVETALEAVRSCSNPDLATGEKHTRACYRMAQEGKSGCCTAFDVPPAYLSQKTHEELRNALL